MDGNNSANGRHGLVILADLTSIANATALF